MNIISTEPTRSELEKKYNEELKQLCKNDDLLISGKKAELIERLLDPHNPKHKARRKCDSLESRVATLLYEEAKLLVCGLLDNPQFKPDDQKKKDEIFCNNKVTCFITKEKCRGNGDHIHGIREHYKEGYYGCEDKWNIVQVVSRLNKTYKKVEIDGKNFILGGPIPLNENQIASLDPDTRKYYDMIKRWDEYCESRSAKRYIYLGTEKIQSIERGFKERYEAYCIESRNIRKNIAMEIRNIQNDE